MDSANTNSFVTVSDKRVNAHLRRAVAKRIDQLMQQQREVRALRHSQHVCPAGGGCDDCDECPNQQAA